MNRIDLVRFLREAGVVLSGESVDLHQAKKAVDALIDRGFLEFEDNQNLRVKVTYGVNNLANALPEKDRACHNCRFSCVITPAQREHEHHDSGVTGNYGFNVCQNKACDHNQHLTSLRHVCRGWEYNAC